MLDRLLVFGQLFYWPEQQQYFLLSHKPACYLQMGCCSYNRNKAVLYFGILHGNAQLGSASFFMHGLPAHIRD